MGQLRGRVLLSMPPSDFGSVFLCVLSSADTQFSIPPSQTCPTRELSPQVRPAQCKFHTAWSKGNFRMRHLMVSAIAGDSSAFEAATVQLAEANWKRGTNGSFVNAGDPSARACIRETRDANKRERPNGCMRHSNEPKYMGRNLRNDTSPRELRAARRSRSRLSATTPNNASSSFDDIAALQFPDHPPPQPLHNIRGPKVSATASPPADFAQSVPRSRQCPSRRWTSGVPAKAM